MGLEDCFQNGIKRKLKHDETEYFDNNMNLIMSIVNRKNLAPFDENMKMNLTILGDDKQILRVKIISN